MNNEIKNQIIEFAKQANLNGAGLKVGHHLEYRFINFNSGFKRGCYLQYPESHTDYGWERIYANSYKELFEVISIVFSGS